MLHPRAVEFVPPVEAPPALVSSPEEPAKPKCGALGVPAPDITTVPVVPPLPSPVDPSLVASPDPPEGKALAPPVTAPGVPPVLEVPPLPSPLGSLASSSQATARTIPIKQATKAEVLSFIMYLSS